LSFPGFQLLAVILFFRRLVYKFTESFCVWILKYNNANSWHFVMAICVTLRLGISALTACMPLHTHPRAHTYTFTLNSNKTYRFKRGRLFPEDWFIARNMSLIKGYIFLLNEVPLHGRIIVFVLWQ
jgi:hypothetical protein